MDSICPPALIYIIYMTIQVILDIIQGYYNKGIVKIILLFVFGAALNMLCDAGYIMVAWFLVFVPFVLMSLIVVIILFMLKKKETTGNVEQDTTEDTPPIIFMPNDYSIQPTSAGCIVVVKHDLTTHGMREVSKTVYCPRQQQSIATTTEP